MGIVRTKMIEMSKTEKEFNPSIPSKVLMREMLARVIKCEIRSRHRTEMRRTGVPAEQPYIKMGILTSFEDYKNSIMKILIL